MAVAIVTGSDSGIGKATAVALAQRGFDIGITWHSDEEGARGTEREVSDAGRRAEVRQVDLSEPEAYRRDVSNAQVHVLDAGHFALDTAADEIAALVRGFVGSTR